MKPRATTPQPIDPFAQFRSVFAQMVEEEVRRVLLQLERVDQTDSPLGRRRHIAATKRYIAAGNTGAGRAGRRYFLSRELIDHELFRLGREQVEVLDQEELDRAAAHRALLAELGLEEA